MLLLYSGSSVPRRRGFWNPYVSCRIVKRSIYKGCLTCEGAIRKMDGRRRKDVAKGATVDVVLKKDQRTGRLTRGVVKDVLTNSSFHPHGIKVRLADGKVGRVKAILP
jgi:uncharacterized repeat protein (TIGR03833 family)